MTITRREPGPEDVQITIDYCGVCHSDLYQAQSELAHAMGAHVVAFTTSESKRDAARELGADEVVVSRNENEMAAHLKSFDFILKCRITSMPSPRCSNATTP
jgi:uncharacterized zinc-type alcohol dehydrogenase-like protein